MALVIGASEDVGRNRQDEDFDRRIGALEKALAALVSGQSQQGSQTTVEQVFSTLLLNVGQIGGSLLNTDTLLFDNADGYVVSANGDAVEVHRQESAVAGAALGSAASAGVSTEAANADHVHKRAVEVRKNSGGSDFIRRRLNLIEGSNVTLTVADDGGNDEVDVTIAAAGAAAAWLDFQGAYYDATATPTLGGDAVANHDAVAVDTGGQTWVLNLPAATGFGDWVLVRRLGNAGGSLNLHPATGDKIEGSTSDYAIANNTGGLLLALDTTDWYFFANI